MSARMNRFAIVTPYYREPRATLERCIASVRAQTVGCDHFLIADFDDCAVPRVEPAVFYRFYGRGSSVDSRDKV